MTQPPPNLSVSPPQAEKTGLESPLRSDFGARFEPPAGGVLRLPTHCANCNEPAGASARVTPPWGGKGRPILVPYCARCARRLEQWKTRHALGLGLSFLAGLALLLGLPLVHAHGGMFTYGLVVVVGAALPQAVTWFVGGRRVPEAGQTSAEVALWWNKDGINGTNSAWIRELAALNEGSDSAVYPLKSPRPVPLHGAVLPLTFAAVSPALFQWLYPTLVVLNLSPSEFELVVDGTSRGTVGVTSLESSSAVRRFSLGAGRHEIEARPSGESFDDAPKTYRVSVSLDAGEAYMFAPGSDGYCFWLERTAYGSAGKEPSKQPLGGKDGLFRLPSAIDTWFAANPPPNADHMSTGGEMVALRQGRCH